MPKEIQIIPSDKCIKEMWEMKKQIKVPSCLDDEAGLTFKQFYKKHKKPLKALFG